jgi:serine beta-lactamase-like protein LACTB, mitochondrial
MLLHSNAFRLSTIVLASALVAGAQADGKWIHSSFVTSQVEGYRDHFDVPGISVAVAKNGNIIYSRGFGWADSKNKVAVTDDTWFRLASVSKPITAILTMELEQQGKIHRNNRIRDIVPELPKHHDYRIWHLLTHQSGIRHYDGKNYETDKFYATCLEATSRFSKDKLLFIPGQEYRYSTHAYTVLGAAIEKVVKEPFNTYLSRRRTAWGLSRLQAEPQSEHKLIAKTYDRHKGKNRQTHRDDLSWKYPGGGMMSTARDLCRLGINLAAGQILNKTSLDTMWKGRDAKIEDSNYGLGWSVGSYGNTRSVAHSGSQNGANSYWRILPDKGIVVVVLSNRDAHDPKKLANFLTNAALSEGNGSLGKMMYD